MKGVKRLLIKAQAQKSKGRTLRHIIVHEQPAEAYWNQQAGYMIQPYYNEHGRITTEGITKTTKQEARDELRRLEREFPKGPEYCVMFISNEMVLYYKDQWEAGTGEEKIKFPAAMLRRAEHMLDERKK